MQVVFGTIIGSFFFVFMILLVKSSHSPSTIPFLGCLIIAGALYAFVGLTHLLGGAVNPAVGLAVIWLFDSQRADLLDPNLNVNSSEFSSYWWAYFLCPFIGGAIAGWANQLHQKVMDNG